MIHKLLARLLPDDYFIRHSDYFDAWQAMRLAKHPAAAFDLRYALEFLRPVACAHPLVRIGGDLDGAYLVPDDLQGIRACFSPGTDNKTGFETELAKRFSIPSMMCDGSVQRESLQLLEGMHTFENRWLKDYDDATTYSLDQWVNSSPFAEVGDLLLQMDIEGGEYAALIFASHSTMQRFRIIVMELHGLERLDDLRFLNLKFMPLMQKLACSFDLVHLHPNNCLPAVVLGDHSVPPVVELTFLRKDHNLNGHYPPQLPHSLDIINVSDKPLISTAKIWGREC
jgi:hypothetical protein